MGRLVDGDDDNGDNNPVEMAARCTGIESVPEERDMPTLPSKEERGRGEKKEKKREVCETGCCLGGGKKHCACRRQNKNFSSLAPERLIAQTRVGQVQSLKRRGERWP
jgi:hypothetical protein